MIIRQKGFLPATEGSVHLRAQRVKPLIASALCALATACDAKQRMRFVQATATSASNLVLDLVLLWSEF
jgi:hypothetical protein